MKLNICIIGLGYVGLPLAVELSNHFSVVGYDLSVSRINELKKFKDRTKEILSKKLKKIKNLKLTHNLADIKNSNFYIITVPTPVYKNKKPDLTNVINATKNVAKFLKKKDIVVYESTVFPGVTEDICGKIIEKITKFKLNQDFFLGYSPERINPGDKKKNITSITKVISASNHKSLNLIFNVYSKIIKAGVFKAKSIRTAEAAKVIENTQRDLNIALINELKIIFDRMKINIFDVLEAASTKWNFLNFKPGMVGGHCIGVDPYYLTYAASKNGINPKVILAGRETNDSMWLYYCNIIEKHIKKNFNKKSIKILILGATFKENCPDFRNSQTINILKKLSKNYKIDLFDPCLDKVDFEKKFRFDVKTSKKQLKNKYEIILITVAHNEFIRLGLKYLKSITKKNFLIVDIKNIFQKGELIEK